MSEKNYFYLSGFISFGLYALFILAFMLYLKETKIQRISPFANQTVIELDVVVDPLSVKKNQPAKIEPKKVVKEEVEKTTSVSPRKTADFKSLFANVKTESSKVSEETVNNAKANPNPTKYKAQMIREKRSEVDIKKTLNSVNTEASKPLMSMQSKYKNDPYYSKIYEIIASRWNPMFVTDGLTATVIVTINNQGNFRYRFKKHSSDEDFNDALEQFLESQTLMSYPPYEKGRSTDIEVLFKSKG